MTHVTPRRIAMWSGPRNISTALLRSWGNRPDTLVVDEPLYAHYLRETGFAHPGAAEIIAHDETDWRRVAERLTGPLPEGKTIFYQKHMAHHLLPGVGRDWLDALESCLLIREPREMLTSLMKIIPEPTVSDTALPQQIELFRSLRQRTGRAPLVLDARDVLEDPRRMLRLLCERLDVEFLECMLSWPPGRRDTDGVWAKYWYDAVERSTTFQPYVPKNEEVPRRLEGVLGECLEHYEELWSQRLV